MQNRNQNNKIVLYITLGILSLFFISSLSRCGSSDRNIDNQNANDVKVTGPVDSLLKAYSRKQNLTIILSDMDFIESTDLYRHKYNIVYTEQVNRTADALKVNIDPETGDSTFSENSREKEVKAMIDSTGWIKVSPVYFDKYINDLGMEIATIDSGKVRKETAPAGYSNYVGNTNYGYWNSANNNWMFYPRFSFFDAWLLYSIMPVRYSGWNSYRTGYYGSGRSYYGTGTNGGRMYGTNSNVSSRYQNKSWTNKSPSAKRSIRSKARTTASRKTSFGGKRSSSRYGSSARSRGSSFGK